MISLLHRIAAAESTAGWPDDRQSRRALKLLEWPRITSQIAGFCLNGHAADRVRRRLPLRRIEDIQLWWALADELRPVGETGRWPPLVEISDVRTWLAAEAPWQLAGEQLVHVASVAEGLDAMREYCCRMQAIAPVWGEAAGQQAAFGAESTAIRRALDRDGRLLDAASPLLARLRRAVASQERAVRREVEKAMGEARRRGWTTESEVTLRGDRFCLPLRSAAKRRLEGIVHDRSASGGTLFVEPAAVVRLHNELAEFRLELASEETRILTELNRAVESAAPALLEACSLLLLIDEVRAGLLWSKRFEGRRPRLTQGGRLRICRGRHPLLLQYGPVGLRRSSRPVSDAARPQNGAPDGAEREKAVDRPEVVPLDLEVTAGNRVVLLSGPNAGGKSVCLKTVGVFVLMAQRGWDVPAREDTELPLFEQLLVDLGDEQSIEMSLSSFSAHLGHLVEFLARADPRVLVLCDEIGSGTDPQEGTALAFAVMEGLASSGATVLASTHFGLLKAAVHDHPRMINAAMDFDEESLRPLFTLRMGVPGASHAFDIARRWDFPAPLLARARDLVGEERFQIERLLTELGTRARDLAEARDEAQAGARSVRRQQQELADKLAGIERSRRGELAKTRALGEQMLDEGRRLIERAVREIRSSGADAVVVKQARDALAKLQRGLPREPDRPPTPAELKPGDRIHIPHLGLSGQVQEIRGDKIIAETNGLRLTLSRAAVEITGAAAEEKDGEPSAATGASWRWAETPSEVSHEIDLRGHRAEEAWDKLDLLIDRAIPAGLNEIFVIHGVGTGKLRQYLHERLKGDRRLAEFREAPLQSGGHGVTIVRLRGD